MTIHLGDDFARRGSENMSLDRGSHGEWQPPQTQPRHPNNVTLRNKKRAVTPDPNDDTFECEKCHGVFDIDNSIKTSKKGPMLCPACFEEKEWDLASADSTNMSMLEQNHIQPEDL